jgi:outer membrane protein assembly factor BamB
MGVVSAPVLYTTPVATYVVYNGIGTACTNGTSGMLTALEISSGSPPTLEPSWCAGNSTGSPIVTTSDGHADGVVWDFTNTGSGPNRTFVGSIGAYDADTGKTLTFTTALPTIVGLRSFNAPIAAKGRIFVPADNTVVALTL